MQLSFLLPLPLVLAAFVVAVPSSADETELPSLDTVYYYDQLIDHRDTSLGTFKQRCWFGGPIVVTTPGESDASVSSLEDDTNTGVMAEKFSGAAIVLEHRFFGESNPYPDLSVASYSVHTVQQAIDDLEYFAKNVRLPMPSGDEVGPEKVPYAGALTSFVVDNKPGLSCAGYASSAVVQAIADFRAYYQPIRETMPNNCSADVQALFAHVDDGLSSGDPASIHTLKENFGVGDLQHIDDFAAERTSSCSRCPTYTFLPVTSWQDLQPVTGPGETFYELCDALEFQNGRSAGPEGCGLQHALAAWGAYYRSVTIQGTCGDIDIDSCLSTYDAENPYRTKSWQWLLCTQFGFWQDGAPEGHPSIVSRFVTPAYNQRQCMNWFSEAFNGHGACPGWNTTTGRIVFVNGRRDPWHEATVAATGVAGPATDMQVHLLADGFHTSDMDLGSADMSPSIAAAQQTALEHLGKWLVDWRPSTNAQTTR
ncbi:peptidase S28 [Trametes elegans]|nr:peptidase S28 [Trametes elegans]